MQEGTPYEVTAKYVSMMEQIVMDMKQEYVGDDGVSIMKISFPAPGAKAFPPPKAETVPAKATVAKSFFISRHQKNGR